MSQHESASPDSIGRPAGRGGLDRDLERLQVLLDFATGLLRTSLAAMTRTAEAGLAQGAAHRQFQEEANRALASLHLHDVAAQMLADLRTGGDFEPDALPSVPDAMAQAHSRLLAEALSDAETPNGGSGRCPTGHSKDGAD